MRSGNFEFWDYEEETRIDRQIQLLNWATMMILFALGIVIGWWLL
jgi:hypothetical protein